VSLAREPAPLAPREAAVDERQLDVLERRCAAKQMEALKDEAEEIAP
jgi:hypothetical protein